MPWNPFKASRRDPGLLTARDVFDDLKIVRAQVAGLSSQLSTINTTIGQHSDRTSRLADTVERALGALEENALAPFGTPQ